MMFKLIAFFRKKHPEFVQCHFSEVPINTVEIIVNGKKIIGTYFHLLYEPQLIGIKTDTVIHPNDLIDQTKMIAVLNPNQEKVFEWEVHFSKTITLENDLIFLFEVVKTNLDVSVWERLYIQRFFKRAIIKNNYVISIFNEQVFDKMLSFFYYPKLVYLISTKAPNGENAFPVDTCRQLGSHFIFGVRTSNKKMQGVIIGDTIAVGLSDYSKKHLIYQLGNYSEDKKEVDYYINNFSGISVPNIVSKYHLVTITEIHIYPTQNVYVGQIISEQITLNHSPFLGHIHKFWLLPKNKTSLKKAPLK